MSLFSFAEVVNHNWHKLNFDTKRRKRIYKSIAVMLKNEVQLQKALFRLYEIYSNGGKKKTNSVAIILLNCYQAVGSGDSLGTALGRWIPHHEASMLRAGEKGSRLIAQLNDLIDVLNTQGKMKGSIAKAVGYPIFLILSVGYLLYFISYKLIPPFAKMSNPASWEGNAKFLYELSMFITNYGIYLLIVVIFFVFLVMASFPYSFGSLRVWLDRIPPYSIYRTVIGASFLLSLSALVSSGVKLNVALAEIMQEASPWYKERVHAALFGINSGVKFGDALANSGYDFPDREAIQFIKAISDGGKLDLVLNDYAREWLEESVVKVDLMASVLFNVGIALVGAAILFVTLGMNDMANMVVNP
ncbi:type II secretion system F family protein [Acerihabitans sp. TG2]|uniref:type II secretion system F family protein n=1 Tax=Acerihabitans sp. TG2 TaxID=3096008 RepID=UPI002B23CFC7|nr:type II secretion system F family protein [Acerihabitans sp. TG2]MEA9392190.1 type II secretion system F family protein [Acerihabitans sp. TG2]